MDNPKEPPSAPRGHKRKASGDAPPALTTAALAAHNLRMDNAPDDGREDRPVARYYWPDGDRRGNGSPVYTATAAFEESVTHVLRVGNGPPADSTGSLRIQDLRVGTSLSGPTTTPIPKKEETMATPDSARPRTHKPIPLPSRITISSLIRLNERFRHDPNLLIPGYIAPTVKTGDSSEYSLKTDRSAGSRETVGDVHDVEEDEEAYMARMREEQEQRWREIEEKTGEVHPDRNSSRAEIKRPEDKGKTMREMVREGCGPYHGP
ncbi:uncharacterized protein H6S33_010781 [Morchella sextelata]|uniref:uncharacterized protein n=1 Tax=Morchella sextelata TaxID=1174677 RepID=UPI001D04E7BD|nr:uncharacterized protein H6S33_010781 [Morchella sextelata]KAH0611516.1 hypothetical protein H6S33_010781 [Morchella sextelata]